MLRYLLAAAIVLSVRMWAQGLPVTRLAGGEPGPAVSLAQAAPARPEGTQLPPLPATQIDPRDAAAALDRQSGLTLSFEEPDPTRFPALRLARIALEAGGAAPTVLNAANEVAVAEFIARRPPSCRRCRRRRSIHATPRRHSIASPG